MAEESFAPAGEERSADIASDPNIATGMPDGDSSEFAARPQPRRFKLWMVLVPVLVVVIALLASDIFRGRMPQEKAFELVSAELPADQTSDAQALGLGGGRQSDSKPIVVEPDAIHQLLGRKPNTTEKRQIQNDDEFVPALVETYEFPGIIKNYNVVVVYVEDASAKNKPMMLKYVRKQE